MISYQNFRLKFVFTLLWEEIARPSRRLPPMSTEEIIDEKLDIQIILLDFERTHGLLETGEEKESRLRTTTEEKEMLLVTTSGGGGCGAGGRTPTVEVVLGWC